MENLKKEMKEIKLSKSAKERILQNCREKIESEQEKQSMKKQVITYRKKPLVAAAALAVVLSVTGITVMAATEKGFFKDEVRFDGAITGQTYQNATDEIMVYAAIEDDTLNVTVEMVKYEIIPYREIEVLGLQKYRVYDAEGNVVMEDVVPENAVMENNQITFQIPAEHLSEGTYKLEVDVISGSKKADPQLMIYGGWECEFTK